MIVLSLVILCLRVLVAAVFIAYAASKLHHSSSFAAVIRSHRLIPDSLSLLAAWTLIVGEMAVGLLFLFNVFPLLAGIAIGVLLLLFSGVLLRARFTDQLDVRSCGCSGAINQKATIRGALLRNVVLLCAVAAVVATIIVSRSISPSSPLMEVAILVCVVAGVVCSQTQLLSPILHSLQTKTTHNQAGESSVFTVKSNRRSFIKLGVQLGIATIVGVGILWNGTLDVFASYPCPGNASCDCGPGGKGPWSGSSKCYQDWDCEGHAGEYVPVYTVCPVFCCGYNQICNYEQYESGEIYCNGGC